MIGVIFNHNIFDDPYKQSSVKKGLERLENVCNDLNEHLFTSFSNVNRCDFFSKDLTDEYITVHYSCELTDAQKAEIADSIKEALTLKKTKYNENELPEIFIVFSQVLSSNCFCFNVK